MKPTIVKASSPDSTLPRSLRFSLALGKLNQVQSHISSQLYIQTYDALRDELMSTEHALKSSSGSASQFMNVYEGALVGDSKEVAPEPKWSEDQLLAWLKTAVVDAASRKPALPESEQFSFVLSKLNEVQRHLSSELYVETYDAIRDEFCTSSS